MTSLQMALQEWQRTNYAGRQVSLLEGAAVLAGGAGILALRGWRASAVMIGGIGALGLADDLIEPRRRDRHGVPAKGLHGHLGALRRGEVTTGAVKAFGIPIIALAMTVPRHGASTMALVDGALIAGSANLANLLDLRPGRALKVLIPAGSLLVVTGKDPEGLDLAATAVLVGAAALPTDLAELGMLGDAGANALGASVGAAAAHLLPAPGRVLALAGVAALTLASEKVSFSAVIQGQPLLRFLDELGRRRAPRPEERA